MKWCSVQWLCFLQLLLCNKNSLGASDKNVEEACLAADATVSSSEECKGAASQLNNPEPRLNNFEDFGEDMGIRQAFGVQEQESVWPVLAKARKYLQDVVYQEPHYESVRSRCKNEHDSCAFWVTLGQCETNPTYMFRDCAPVCLACDYLLKVDQEAKLQTSGEPSMQEQVYYGEDIGIKQYVPGHLRSKVQEVILAARNYVQNVIYADPRYRELLGGLCKNLDASCAHLAVLDECQNNPGYMNRTCGPVCQSCLYHLKEVRCPLDPNAIDAFYPGDLNKMFERITTQPEYQQYDPKALSRPDLLPGDTEETAPYKLGPWVVTLENFLTPEEANRLIEIGAKIGFERSGKQGNLKPDGTYDTYYDEGRTSTSSWCAHDCLTDPVVQAVTGRISNLTGTPEPNFEFFQILKYEVGQFYQTHHDCMLHHLQRQEGLRVLTVYLYLNDVEEGGGTNFPTLDLTVMPKVGRVVIWPSVLNEDPNRDDNRTDHQAFPVIKGVKYGTNAWIHQRDFKTPFANGCE